jgi:hypothetical protein
MRSLIFLLVAACGAPNEAPPLGPRPDPTQPGTENPTLPRPTKGKGDAGLVTQTRNRAEFGFAPDEQRADPLEARDAGTSDGLLPPEGRMPDAGLIADAGQKL